ncbi:MAG TPA: RNase H family protein [Pirellulaceae bacterium]|nr:RNase H family protein [Pirellulaceae bacterium]
MTVPAPHFLLFSEARSARSKAAAVAEDSGLWHFVLESVNGSTKLEATDEEPELDPERLELLAVIRGLEALDQPSKVTLVTRSRCVARGLRFGIDRWRENGWQWECFGKMAPIKDSDLWQRIDQALQFHKVRCRTWRFDPPEEAAPQPKLSARPDRNHKPEPARRDSRLAAITGRLGACFRAIKPVIRGSMAQAK